MDVAPAGADPDVFTFELPEPPSMNKMLSWAMMRTKRTRGGGFTKKDIPGLVYDQRHNSYETLCTKAMREQKIRVPRTPWSRWEMTAVHFRLFNLRDPFELLAGLKWVVDWLVHMQFVTNDSPREVPNLPLPRQIISRKDRGVTITIRRLSLS